MLWVGGNMMHGGWNERGLGKNRYVQNNKDLKLKKKLCISIDEKLMN